MSTGCFFIADAHFNFSTPTPILTRSRELIAHLAGRPTGDDFTQSLQSLEKEMELASPFVVVEHWVEKTQAKDKAGRGKHPAVSVGLSLGGGSTARTASGESDCVLTLPAVSGSIENILKANFSRG